MGATWGDLESWGDLDIWWLEPQPATGGGGLAPPMFHPAPEPARKEKHTRLRVFHATWVGVVGHKEAAVQVASDATRTSVEVGRCRMAARGTVTATAVEDVSVRCRPVRVGRVDAVVDERIDVVAHRFTRSARSLADEQLLLTAYTHFFGGSA